MTDFIETRSPLTNENVQAWARANFAAPFRALPRAARLQWIQFDESFTISRAIWRSLGRSSHKQLLVIGGYAPGPAGDDDEPTDRVTAHVHEDEAEVSFFRIAESAHGSSELQPVNSTSTVAFHAPFCDVGDDTGGSKAIHRVSALILYYFLAAGHVKELSRTKSDPTMFTRNFRDACLWVQNEGERPLLPPSRKSEPSTPALEKEIMAVRPKRSSTVSSASRSFTDDIQAPPIKRAATDSLNVKVKRERLDEDYPTSIVASAIRPKKHPRRTLSEQIIVPSKLNDSSTTPTSSMIQSPRSPAPERVNRALTERINHLKDENAGLKASVNGLETERSDLQQRMARDAHVYRGMQIESDALRNESEAMKKDVLTIKDRLATVEAAAEKLRAEVERLGGAEERSQELQKELRSEMEGLRGRVESSEKEAQRAKEELLIVKRGLTKELGDAVKKWGT